MERYLTHDQGIYPEEDVSKAGPSNFDGSSHGTYSAQTMKHDYYTSHMSMPDPMQLSSALWFNQFFALGSSSMADHTFIVDRVDFSYGSIRIDDPTNVVEDQPIDPSRRSQRQRHLPTCGTS